MLIFLLLIVSLIANIIYSSKLTKSLAAAPRLSRISEQVPLPAASVAVIIPAYNENANIEACIQAVLASTKLTSSQLQVWVVDDGSTDDTLAIAQSVQQQLNDSRLHILAGKPRPLGERWVGKNWACSQAAEQVQADFLLFIDGDVRLKPGAIETALEQAQRENIDLLSLAPAIVCGCFAEWLVQPLMINNLAVGFDFAAVNDPHSETAFAAGPFMFFRHSAYEKLGGHRAMREEVVEDVEMARAIKAAGMKLQLLLGSELMSVRMYQSWGALWEGWTKNFYQGSRRQLGTTLYFAFCMVLIYPLPWLGLTALIAKFSLNAWQNIDYLSAIMITVAIAFHYYLRVLSGKDADTPPHYWWLSGIGGALIAILAIDSIIKTETGWGWTWRGRSLS